MTTEARDYVTTVILPEYDPVEGTVRVVREKTFGDQVVVAVEFENAAGVARQAMFEVEADGGRWRSRAGFVGRPGSNRTPGIWDHSGGWGNSNRHVRGGWLSEPDAVAVRATDPDGRVQQDDIEAGVAILRWTGSVDLTQVEAELLDASGRVLRSSTVDPPTRIRPPRRA